MTISKMMENKAEFITALGIQVAEFFFTFHQNTVLNSLAIIICISLTISYSSEISMHINTNKAMIKHIEYFCTLNNNFIRDI